ncbi:MAG: LLM class flavin-dependent oxidoreductase [Chloroflexi bacterium]|nr:LLM class flavin-dependent oxidoreductase [Chloroflexota bacterium]
MNFGDFLFPESRTPDTDYTVVNEALAETMLADRLGYHSVWLGEHHFDGVCTYADPMTFGGAVVASTNNVRVGFSAVQTAFHHPVRLAEQIALLDNLSGGRIMVGTARGSAFNRYEYRGYGVEYGEAQSRLVEAEEILTKAWTEAGYRHAGKHWNVEIPILRPKVVQKPHPPLIRAIASENSLLQMARQGRPFMLSMQPLDKTRRMFDLYRCTMSDAGYEEDYVAQACRSCWIWFNGVVAQTDAEAAEIARPAYAASIQHITGGRERMNTASEQIEVEDIYANSDAGPEDDLVYGSPEKIAEVVAELDDIGVGGVMIQFRIGEMTWEQTESSMRLFADNVMPRFA